MKWESATIIFASVTMGYILGSEKARSRIGKELRLCYRGFKNEMKRMRGERLSEEEKSRFRRLMRQVFPEGLKAEK